MHCELSRTLWAVLIAAAVLGYGRAASADFVVDPFPASGQGGGENGHTFLFGQGGEVWEVESIFNIAGQDLNGATSGTAAVMGIDALPAGVGFEFTSMLSGDATDITLTYTWTNNTGSPLIDVTVLSYLDVDIDFDFEDETAQVVGAPDAGQSFEIDGASADLASHIYSASLDGTNGALTPADVDMALSFDFPTIADGQAAGMQLQLSDDGDFISGASLRIVQSDPVTPDTLTYSGVAVPEPEASALLVAALLGLSALARRGAASSS